MKKIEQIIKQLKEDENMRVLQNAEGDTTAYLIYQFNDFFLETYRKEILVGLECISEKTAMFCLTARY